MSITAKLTCDERNSVLIDPETGLPHKRATVESSLTDLSGVFGDPVITTLWNIDGRLIRDTRHPNPDGGADRAPCEHYEEEED